MDDLETEESIFSSESTVARDRGKSAEAKRDCDCLPQRAAEIPPKERNTPGDGFAGDRNARLFAGRRLSGFLKQTKQIWLMVGERFSG